MNRRMLLVGGGAMLVGGGLVGASFATMGTAEAYATDLAAARGIAPADGDPIGLVRYATMAASGHNTQPWLFRVSGSSIAIRPDFSRRTPIVDPDDHHLYVSLGCATENLVIAAAALGLASHVRFDESAGGSIAIDLAASAAVDAEADLFAAIPRRQSTRAEYDGRAVPSHDVDLLAAAAANEGVETVIITDRPRLDRVRDAVIAGNTVQVEDPAFVAELKSWMRFNPRAALRSGDGLFSGASGNAVAPSWLGSLMFGLFFRAGPENDKYRAQFASTPGIAVFSGERADPASWINVGRACQRFALRATALGLKVAFVNQPVEVASLRDDLAALAGTPGRRPDIVLRFGYGPTMPMSPRRPVTSVLEI